MRILVTYSPGPGGLIGAQLIAAGRDMTYLDHTRTTYQRDRTPQRVRSRLGDHQCGFTRHVEAGELTQTYDAIILSAQAHEVEKLAAVLPRAVKPGTVILPLIAGLDHIDKLEKACPGAIVLDGQHYLVVLTDSDGNITHRNGTDQILIGRRGPETADAADAVAALFDPTRLDVRIVDDVDRLRWDFMAKAAPTVGLAALMGTGADRIGRAGDIETQLWNVMHEVAIVATAAGHRLNVADLAAFMDALPNRVDASIGAMLNDIAVGKLGEITELVAQLHRRARGACLPVPLFDLLHTTLQCRIPTIEVDAIDKVHLGRHECQVIRPWGPHPRGARR